MATVQIEERDYQALMNRLEALEKAVGYDAKSVPPFSMLVKTRPYSHTRPVEDDVPEFRFADAVSSPAWNACLELAKAFLTENDKYYMDRTPVIGNYQRPYIRSIQADKVRKIAKLPIEKQMLAAQMISEIAEVYNRYFVEAHKEVVYKPSPQSDPVIIKVMYNPNEQRLKED